MKLVLYQAPPVPPTLTEPTNVEVIDTETFCYGTVMCSFAKPLAHYRETDPDLRGKVSIDIPPPKAA